MNVNELIKDVHENAVVHGWWQEDRGFAEVIALLHSEASEALEEYRSGRPMLWYSCNKSSAGMCCDDTKETDCACSDANGSCVYKMQKPEGIAIELIDCAIRIFDYFGKSGLKFADSLTIADLISIFPAAEAQKIEDVLLTTFIADLHSMISLAYTEKTHDDSLRDLLFCVGMIFVYLSKHKQNCELLLTVKNDYNKTRPFRHGNKLC